MTIELQFYGHACFGIRVNGAPILLIDPYVPGTLEGHVRLRPIDDSYAYIVATHDHVDHNAVDQVPGAVLHPPSNQAFEVTNHVPPPPSKTQNDVPGIKFNIHTFTVDHDEFGGRLRGGTSDILTIDIDDVRIVHCGDIGERLTKSQLAEWDPGTIDILIMPVGGYYTLGADGAFELTTALNPRGVIPCHASEHGVTLPELASAEHFLRRFGEHWFSEERDGTIEVTTQQLSDAKAPGTKVHPICPTHLV